METRMGPEFFLSSIRVAGTNVTLHVVMAILAAIIAAGKGRNAVGWFFIGLISSCLGVLVVLILPDVRETEMDQRHRDDEVRRLKERLNQEQSRRSNLQSRVLGRLDAHDVALGLDTREIDGPLDVAEALPVAADAAEAPEWYYEDQGHPAGPISRRSLRALLNSGAIDRATLVWHPRLGDNWHSVGELPDFG